MYEWLPTKNNKKAMNLILLFLSGAALLFAFTSLFGEMPFRWAFQLTALCFLTVAIFLTTRYVMKSFLYRIFEGDRGGFDLTVTELTSGGKRRVTVCRVGLSEVNRVILLDAADGGESAAKWRAVKKEGKKIFDYAADLDPARSIVVYLRESGEELILRLSYDKTLYDILLEKERREE